MSPEHHFGIWLREARTARDLTQEVPAEAAGCVAQTVRSLESGRRRPSGEMAAHLGGILLVPPAEKISR